MRRKSVLFAFGVAFGGILANVLFPDADAIQKATYGLVIAACLMLSLGKEND